MLPQCQELFLRIHLEAPDLDLRTHPVKFAQDHGHQIVDRRGHESDRDAAGLAAGCRPPEIRGLFRMHDHHARPLEKCPPFCRHFDAPARAVKQFQPKLPFQRPDLLAERRLGQPQPPGRAPEMQLLGHGDEVAQMPQFHADRYVLSIGLVPR